MNDADIGLFQFDFDLTWAAFFLNRHGIIYARYGSRAERQADAQLSLMGLARIMSRVLELHKTESDRKHDWTVRTPASIKSLPAPIRSGKQCMHCHQVYQFERRDLGEAFTKDQATQTYPLAENVGMTLDPDLGNIVRAVTRDGPAAQAGIEAKDEIVSINRIRVLSAADASWALHNAKGHVTIELKRGDETRSVAVTLPEGWRRRDISWRGSMWDLRPHPGFGGRRLSDEDLKRLGVEFAFRVDYIVDWGEDAATGKNAKAAGIRKGDLVTSIAGKSDFRDELEFQSWFRLTRKAGEEIELAVRRDGKALALKLKILP